MNPRGRSIDFEKRSNPAFDDRIIVHCVIVFVRKKINIVRCLSSSLNENIYERIPSLPRDLKVDSG